MPDKPKKRRSQHLLDDHITLIPPNDLAEPVPDMDLTQPTVLDIVETITDINEQKKKEQEFDDAISGMADREVKIQMLRAQLKALGHDPM